MAMKVKKNKNNCKPFPHDPAPDNSAELKGKEGFILDCEDGKFKYYSESKLLEWFPYDKR